MPESALDFVIAALAKVRQTNDHLPRASRTMLAQLQTANTRGVPWPTEPQLQPASNKAELLEPIRARVRACTKCAHLACSRTQTVFGVGNPDADLMLLGEAPGIDDDKQAETVAGRHRQ